jgi:1-aminocyclopropane-1-carboxylate deaminase/D-cysteine desulfhydrase-like pyridoxal-dependent ACC family enzyme
MLSFNFDTPLEEHLCGEKKVYVKRDDLLNGNMDLPPWAKMEGIRRVLESGELSKDRPIIHLSVRVSYSGWALAYIGKELGFKIKIAYPDTKDYPKKALEKIESLGAELVPMKPNILSIVISSVGILAEKEKYQMMPYAFNHSEYITYFKERTQSIMQKKNFKHLVINAGSGVTPSGVLQGFMNFETFGVQSEEDKKYAHLITTASKSSIASMLKKWNVYDRNQTQIHETPHDFFDDMDWCETPFPCNGNWDKKAWSWLKENGCKLDGDVLFYNLGGACASHFWRQ